MIHGSLNMSVIYVCSRYLSSKNLPIHNYMIYIVMYDNSFMWLSNNIEVIIIYFKVRYNRYHI